MACRILGTGRTKVYRPLGDGSLPSLKIGRRLVRLGTAREQLAAREKAGLDRGAV